MTAIFSQKIGILTVILTGQCFVSSALCTVSPQGAKTSALFFSTSSNINSHHSHANAFHPQANLPVVSNIAFQNSILPVSTSRRPSSKRTTLIGTTNGETDITSSQTMLSTIRTFCKTHVSPEKINTTIATVRHTLKEGGGQAVGLRGERHILIQMGLFVLFAINKIPLLDALVTFILGPVVTFGGLALVVRALQELGIANWSPYVLPNIGEEHTKSFMPWSNLSKQQSKTDGTTSTSTPPFYNNTTLVTTGLYSHVRHPIYTGTIAFCLGLSSWTKSTFRMVLSLVLAYSLHLKSDEEDAWLEKQWGARYRTYSKTVAGKFVPEDWIQRLPWMQVNQTSSSSPV